MNRFCEFVQKHINFEFQKATWFGVIFALAIIPAILFLPERCGYENGIIENIQLIILALGIFFSLRAKTDKKFFYFVAMVLGILFIREVNCFRTVFFAIPGTENEFYRWSEIKYGWLAHVLYGIYMAIVGIYFLANKLFLNLWDKLWNLKLPFWNFILLLVGIITGLYAEEIHHLVFEESAELLFYVTLIGFVYLYSHHKDFVK